MKVCPPPRGWKLWSLFIPGLSQAAVSEGRIGWLFMLAAAVCWIVVGWYALIVHAIAAAHAATIRIWPEAQRPWRGAYEIPDDRLPPEVLAQYRAVKHTRPPGAAWLFRLT